MVFAITSPVKTGRVILSPTNNGTICVTRPIMNRGTQIGTKVTPFQIPAGSLGASGMMGFYKADDACGLRSISRLTSVYDMEKAATELLSPKGDRFL